MKKQILLNLRSAGAALALLAGFYVNHASAQIYAQDDASVYANWLTGTNYGFGFQPWVQAQTGTGGGNYTGFYLGNAGDPIATGGKIWGIYANGSSGTNASEAFRSFSNSLPANATFKIRWQTTGIGNSITNVGGFNLRNGNNTNLMTAATFLGDGSRFSLYYLAGISDNFTVYDGNNNAPYPIPLGFSSFPIQVEFTLLPDGNYNLTIENAAGTSVLYSSTEQPLAGSGTIDSVALYDFQTTDDQTFNNMAIFYTPPQIVNVQPADGSIYVSTPTNLTFAVTTLGSQVFSNNIQLTLNGVVQTGANWTVINSGTSSNSVVLNTPLQANVLYTGTITATDTGGNSVTNNFSFNTWVTSPDNIYVAAQDYNYTYNGVSGLWY